MWTALLEITRACALPMLLTACIAYLLGSINTAIILTKARQHDDIRNYGSGNAGATNVLRTQGWGPAIATGLGDLLKSLVAVLLGQFILMHWGGGDFDPTYLKLIGGYLAGLFCVVGHLFPLYFGFRGGKGVVATLGLGLILDWRAALLALASFTIVVGLTRMVSAASLCGGLGMVVGTFLFPTLFDDVDATAIGFCTAMMGAAVLLVFIKHIPNIRRILNGTESRFGKNSSSKTEKNEENTEE